jgi:hypothetical protein
MRCQLKRIVVIPAIKTIPATMAVNKAGQL